MEEDRKLSPLRWVHQSAFSANLKARDEWRTKSGMLASGKIRYVIEFRLDKVYWRIFMEGELTNLAHGWVGTEQEVKDAVEAWRNDNLEMPIFKAGQSLADASIEV